MKEVRYNLGNIFKSDKTFKEVKLERLRNSDTQLEIENDLFKQMALLSLTK